MPSSMERAKLAREAEAVIKAANKELQGLYYGLRAFWWDSIPKGEIFKAAKAVGELDDYYVAPGRRQSSGHYSRDEYDTARLNREFWPAKRKEFYTQFEAEFGTPTGSNMKAIADLRKHLLEVALAEFGEKLTNPKSNAAPLEQVKNNLLSYNAAKLADMNKR